MKQYSTFLTLKRKFYIVVNTCDFFFKFFLLTQLYIILNIYDLGRLSHSYDYCTRLRNDICESEIMQVNLYNTVICNSCNVNSYSY
jgi:hypothetical protein